MLFRKQNSCSLVLKIKFQFKQKKKPTRSSFKASWGQGHALGRVEWNEYHRILTLQKKYFTTYFCNFLKKIPLKMYQQRQFKHLANKAFKLQWSTLKSADLYIKI